MVKQVSNVRKHLRRFLAADPGRFAGGSAVSDPLGLLAVERERLAVLRSPQHNGSPQAAATADQGTGSASAPPTGPGSSTRPRPDDPVPARAQPGLAIYSICSNPGDA